MVPGQVHYSSACQCVDDDTAMIEVRPDTRSGVQGRPRSPRWGRRVTQATAGKQPEKRDQTKN